ncbi:type II secretion system F family protein [Novosphingobium sp.]|uniref:type II secretion system F family protein n=1 Tax=Novosphingobium sp. TaxID=1874826 RepID=UPI0025ED6B2B|nr:type II secretion system F family protein [Novosphingobium sp.]
MLDLIASTPSIRVSVLLVVFALVVLGIWTLVNLATKRMAVRGELRDIHGSGTTFVNSETLTARNDSAWIRLVDRIEKAGLDLSDTKSDDLVERLRAAGYTSPVAPRLYTLLRLVLVIALPTLLVLFSLWSGRELSYLKLYIFGSIFAAMGLFIPALYVRAKADRRREEIVNGFPDCLDLMLVCVEAGLGLEAALDRVAKEMINSHPLVSGMLATATLRLRAGASREEALRRLADEAGVDEIRSFSTLLIQSDKLGTSIATTLRVYASEMRERRRMRAEEKAHRLPVLISIPLVVFMLPVMIGTLMLPAAIRVVRQLLPALNGG